MKWLARRISPTTRGQGGFSLIETIATVAIIGVVGVVLLRAMDANNRTTGQLDQQTVAQNMVAKAVEDIRNRTWDFSDDYTDLEVSVPTALDTGLSLNVVAECNDDGTDIFSTCDANSTWQRISLTVSTPDGGTVFRVCTFRAAR